MHREKPSSLSLSEPALLRPGPWENQLIWFPIIGWAIGGYLQFSRIDRAILDMHRQLKRREHFPSEEWSAVGVEPTEAERVARAVAGGVASPNHHFLPDDSLMLLLLDEEGLGFLVALFAIEKELGVVIRPGEFSVEGTFRDL